MKTSYPSIYIYISVSYCLTIIVGPQGPAGNPGHEGSQGKPGKTYRLFHNVLYEMLEYIARGWELISCVYCSRL
jgi:hypothetical protein